MQMCIMAGYKLRKNETWINLYLQNPNLASTPNYFRISNDSLNNSETNNYSIILKTDKEIAELVSMDEYFLERYHSKNQKQKEDKIKSIELTKRIYKLIRYNYSNPLSLQELARIKIRNNMLSIDYNIKAKIEKNILDLPTRLREYLLLNEFLN
jgi:hypothetical protein